MKSFQRKTRSLNSSKCTHNKWGKKWSRNLSSAQKLEPKHIQSENTTAQKDIGVKPKQLNEDEKVMKYLIAINEQYFQDKLTKSNDGKPCRLKLHIPSCTGQTNYKRDYLKIDGGDKQFKKTHEFKEKKIKSDLFTSTTYAKEFMGHQNEEKTWRRKKDEPIDSDAPTFLDSEYKHNYQNWGPGSRMISMKPNTRPATTNLPFHPTTVYATEFTRKTYSKKENFNPNSSGLNLNQKRVSSPLLYMTTNKVFFDKKANSKENDLKPKTHTVAVDGRTFKGKTEYQCMFVNDKITKPEQAQKKPLADLQNLILNL